MGMLTAPPPKVVQGGPAPRDRVGDPEVPWRIGDVLHVSREPAEAEVTAAAEDYVAVRWPWPEPGMADDVAFRVGPDGFATLWRLDLGGRAPGEVRVGDRIRLWIPPLVVYVVWSGLAFKTADQLDRGEPYRDDQVHLGVLPAGQAWTTTGGDERVAVLSAYGSEAVRVELLYRPYPFLEDGDRVRDVDGRTWLFTEPFWWVDCDRDDPTPPDAAPRWPLTLTSRFDGGDDLPTDEDAETVAAATQEGGHAAVEVRWRQLTKEVPIHPAEPAGEHDRWLGLDREERAAHTARIRGRLAGMTLEDLKHEREVARVIDHNASKVVLDEEDYRHQQAAELQLDLVDEALAWMRATGAASYTPPVTENP